MPQIREYRQRIEAPGPMQSQRASVETAGLEFSGLKQIGSGMREMGNAIMQQEQKQKLYDAQKEATVAQEEWLQKNEELQQKAPPGAKGYVENYSKNFDEWRNKRLAQVEDSTVRKHLDGEFSRLKVSFMDNAIRFQSAERGREEKRFLEDLGNKNNNLIFADPSKRDMILERERKTIDANPHFSESEKATYTQMRTQQAWNASMDGWVTKLESNPDLSEGQVAAALVELKREESGYIGNTTDDAYRNALKRLSSLKENLSRRRLDEDLNSFDSDMKQIEDTGVDSGRWTEKEIRTRIKDPRRQELMVKRQSQARLVGEQIAMIKDAPDSEVMARLESMRSKLSTTTEYTKEHQAYVAAQQAFARRVGMMQKDPAGYVLQNSSAAKTLYDSYAKNPSKESFEAYADASIAEQKRISPNSVPSVLTDSQMATFKAQLDSVGRGEANATQVLAVMQNQRQIAGKHWDSVVADLQREKVLSDEQYVAANMLMRPEVQHVAEDLVRASTLKMPDLLKMTDAKQSEVEDYARSALAPLASTFRNSPAEKEVYMSHFNALTKLALYTGKTSQDDINELARKTVLDEYNFEDSYRVPVEHDPSAVAWGVEVLRDRLPEMDIIPPQTKTQMRPEDVKNRYLKNLARNGVWVTTEKGDGLQLIDETGRDVVVRDGQGYSPLKFTWGEIKAQSLDAQKMILNKGIR